MCIRDSYTITPQYNQSAAFLPTNIDSGSPQAAYFDGGMTWIPGVPITYTTSVEILDAIEQQWKLNGTGSYTTFASTTDWNLVASGPGTLTQIQIYRPFNPPQTHAFKALRIDGKILINPGETGDPGTGGSILTFASPNKDLKFFKPGEVVQQAETTITGQALIDNSPLFIGTGGSNSDDATGLYDTSVASSYVQLRAYFSGIQFTSPYIVNNRLRIYMAGEAGYNGLFLNGPTFPSDTTAGYGPIAMGAFTTGQQNWIECTSQIPSFPFLLENIGVKNIDGGGYIRLYGIEVDGVVLMTPQPATVLADF